MRVSVIVFLFIVFTQNINAQSFAINTDGSTANASAILDVKSSDKGVLVPRMSKLQKNAITSPATGLLVFQDAPDSVGFYYYNGTAWLWLATANASSSWLTTGNTGTDTAINFIGTTDNMPLRFKQNNQWVGQFDFNQGAYFFGKNAGKNNTSGIGNIAIGSQSLGFNTVASRNVAIGDSAMYSQSFNNSNISYFQDNTAIGSKALFFNQPTTSSNGAKNTAVGSEALYLNTTGQENTAVGTGAMHDNITGQQNTAVGRSANRLAKSGNNNSYFGYESGYTDSLGFSNTGIGNWAMRQHRSGGSNVAIGYAALFNDTTGGNKVAIGALALSNDRSTTLPNTAIGFNALASTNNGNGNIAVGYAAGSTNSAGSRNTIIGYEAALGGNASGVTAVGFMAARASFNGSNIVAIGDSALFASTQANNIAIGTQALRNLNGGNSNTALGKRAMYNAVSNSQNVAVGQSALDSLSSGNFNTAIGHNTGFFNTGTQHTLVGAGAAILTNGIVNATAIGSFSAATQSNTLILGSIAGVNGSPTSASVGIGTTTPTARLDVASSFKLGSVGSINNSIIRTNATVDVGNIAANSELDVLVTITNISATAPVSVSPSADIEAGISIEWARVSAVNTVKIRFRNNTGVDINPASQTYQFLVVQ